MVPRFDLISPIGLRRLAETYGEGAIKYGAHAWEKGIPDNLMNHLLAHVFEWLRGDRSEDHLGHAAWGLFALMHFEELRLHGGTDAIRDRSGGDGDSLPAPRRLDRTGLPADVAGLPDERLDSTV